jgi:hypothetical protein
MAAGTKRWNVQSGAVRRHSLHRKVVSRCMRHHITYIGALGGYTPLRSRASCRFRSYQALRKASQNSRKRQDDWCRKRPH